MPSSGATSRDPFDLPVQFLKGVGPRRAAALNEHGVRTLGDLLFWVPRRYLDRTAIVTVAALRALSRQDSLAVAGSEDADVRKDYTVVGTVRSFQVMGVGRRARFVVVLGDNTGTMQCVWFNGVQYWRRAFRIGEMLAASGRPGVFAGILQFVHPDIDRIAAGEDEEEPEPAKGASLPPLRNGEESPPLRNGEGLPPLRNGEVGVNWAGMLNTGGLVPLYSSTQDLQRVGLDSAGFRRLLHGVVREHLSSVQEVLPASLRAARSLPELGPALAAAHFPGDPTVLREALRRLKYHELFLFQLKLALRRHHREAEQPGIAFDPKSTSARALVDRLPFTLTKAQVKVIREITTDMASGAPMNRLLQGDVGSGKTVVALLAMLVAADNGYQAAFLAPTEILAEQHARTLQRLLGDLPIRVRLLVGAQRSRLRREALEDIQQGGAQIIVGTHAILEKDVAFARLGLVVIDEQHRFGVMQRAALRGKGTNPHVLVMTATPIPRTLSLTLYGDLEVSLLNELPRDRKLVRTTVADESHRAEVYQFVREQIAAGRQAYFVAPLVEESESLALKAATAQLEHLQQEVFPDLRVGLLHGKMPSDEKEAVMRSFLAGGLHLLVATTVIEVGIDVPNASVMVIEDAERFGLSQLHQLRGRVGRGAEQSYCVLMTKRWIAQRARGAAAGAISAEDQQRQAEQRLAAMVATNDGFQIAEMDLRLRGPGDYFGTRQSGMPEFRVADILADGALLDAAREDAFALVTEDAHLQRTEHRALATFVRRHVTDEFTMLQVG